jgi:hypothetical protein
MDPSMRIGIRCTSCGDIIIEDLVRAELVPMLVSGRWMSSALAHLTDHLVSCPEARLLDTGDARVLRTILSAAGFVPGRHPYPTGGE